MQCNSTSHEEESGEAENQQQELALEERHDVATIDAHHDYIQTLHRSDDSTSDNVQTDADVHLLHKQCTVRCQPGNSHSDTSLQICEGTQGNQPPELQCTYLG